MVVPAVWAIAIVLAAAAIPAFLVTVWQGEFRQLINVDCWLIGMAMGTATILYFVAMLYSDVIRVIFLFYLLPLWTTLSARLIYGELIHRTQLVVISAALAGVWLLLGGGSALPIPQNIGDWCAIAAGFCWGVSLSLLRGRAQTPPFSSTTATLVAGLVLSVIAIIVFHLLGLSDATKAWIPEPTLWLKSLPVALIFGAVVLFPALLGQIWGARRIPAPTAALLTMTEIMVATASAGWLIGTELQPISLLGGGHNYCGCRY